MANKRFFEIPEHLSPVILGGEYYCPRCLMNEETASERECSNPWWILEERQKAKLAACKA